jgi:uncharacterized OsmC-like protein
MSGNPLVTVESAGGKFTQKVLAGNHNWLVDEPLELGGDDKGPTPYDMLLASLGSCKAITMQMYAQRKGWALEGVKIDLEHSREHRDDCATCDGKVNRIDVIDCVITITGDLDEDQRSRLAEIAGKCPVHQTLTNHLDINTMVVD